MCYHSDRWTVEKVLRNISDEGISILLVEHNFRLATSLASRVFVMGKAHVGYSQQI